jgi:CO/xanthine dehydrogenase Mo-binding subunit
MTTTLEQDRETTNQGQTYKVIGTRPIRHDGVDKVTGRALYGADIRLAGMFYGAVLRSPHAHARILSIDTRQAEALPGVKAVVTAADLPDIGDKVTGQGEGTVNMRYMSNNVLARDKVLYDGHPVAAVAAANVHIAQAALELIQVTYEVLPPVLDVRQAMQSDAPILLDELRTDELGSQETSLPTSPVTCKSRPVTWKRFPGGGGGDRA